jgi:transcriptional regulator with XRE-family HTH domain
VAFPSALKALMSDRQLSYRQLAYKTQLSAGYLNHLTGGTRPVPGDHVVAIIAAALQVEPDYFPGVSPPADRQRLGAIDRPC